MPQNRKTKTKDSNPDPITGEPGAHPLGVGLGTAAGGAVAGAAAGTLAGPVGTVVGTIVGGVAGGLAGKSVAESIDPTAEDAYWRKNFRKRPYVKKGTEYDVYRPAYMYGVTSHEKYQGQSFEDAESKLRRGWTKARGDSALAWDVARDAVRDAYDRTIQLREEQLRVHKEPVTAGEVKLRKEVSTEQKTVDVPVQREEVVIERKPASRRAAKDSDFRSEEIRVPVRGDKVRVDKETVVREEVKVGKRAVPDTRRVTGTVRKEELRVDKEGDAKIRDTARKSSSR